MTRKSADYIQEVSEYDEEAAVANAPSGQERSLAPPPEHKARPYYAIGIGAMLVVIVAVAYLFATSSQIKLFNSGQGALANASFVSATQASQILGTKLNQPLGPTPSNFSNITVTEEGMDLPQGGLVSAKERLYTGNSTAQIVVLQARNYTTAQMGYHNTLFQFKGNTSATDSYQGSKYILMDANPGNSTAGNSTSWTVIGLDENDIFMITVIQSKGVQANQTAINSLARAQISAINSYSNV